MDPFLSFQQHDALRRFLIELKQYQTPSLKQFHDPASGGFFQFYQGNPGAKLSFASTSMSLLSLIVTGEWESQEDWNAKTEVLAHELLTRSWDSANLGPNNVFTVAFVLEAITALLEVLPKDQRDELLKKKEHGKRISDAEGIVRAGFAHGGFPSVVNYPPSAYLTQLASRVLKTRGKLSQSQTKAVRSWAWRELSDQLALLLAKSKAADLTEMIYALIIAVTLSDVNENTPERNLLIHAALDQFFQHQLEDGSWPRSRPRFPDTKWGGSAFSFDYELLVQLLIPPQLQDQLLNYLPQLSKAARAVIDSRYEFKNGGFGWTSGNYRAHSVPESWATASIYHFSHNLERLNAEAIRRSAFEYLEIPYSRSPIETKTFAPNFLDCPIVVEGKEKSLTDTLLASFVLPIQKSDGLVIRGKGISKDVPMSAIFYGPPGTSKTQLAVEIANYLGWPLLAIDPSHFLRHGMEEVQTQADRIFRILTTIERVVVLLDEFDEMVRDRQSATEILSRFLTTAMLPKLTKINESRRIIFIVATNHIGNFDLAIRRPGRFDAILQVMPPTCEAKLSAEKGSRLFALLKRLTKNTIQEQQFAALTFSEYTSLKKRLIPGMDLITALNILETAYKNCTLQTLYDEHGGGQTWEEVSREQSLKIRVPS